jgi:hypothetical protein
VRCWWTGCTASAPPRWPSNFDVDTVDANEIRLGLGADLGGLTSAEARRVVADVDRVVDVVALTIAEYVPRQVMQLQQILAGFPLLGSRQARRGTASRWPGPPRWRRLVCPAGFHFHDLRRFSVGQGRQV